MASRLLAPRLRPAVAAFYDVVRTADDIADDPEMPRAQRLAGLDAIEAALDGTPWEPADRLRAALCDLGHPGAIEHARAMLTAFRADASGVVCRDWADLMAYCEYSAVPVGRFLLEIHDEDDPRAQKASDALCTALQILNHLQDLRADHERLGRLYLPADFIARSGGRRDDIASTALTPALRGAVDEALARTENLLSDAAPLPRLLHARGLAAEAAAILALARALHRHLRMRDMIAARVAPLRRDWARAALAGAWRLVVPGRRRMASA